MTNGFHIKRKARRSGKKRIAGKLEKVQYNTVRGTPKGESASAKTGKLTKKKSTKKTTAKKKH